MLKSFLVEKNYDNFELFALIYVLFVSKSQNYLKIMQFLL